MIYVEDILNIGLLIDPLRDVIMALESIERERHHRGRPRIEIERNQLEYFVECGFRVKDIADMYHCSKRTIERRMHELSVRSSNFSQIPDTELDNKVSDLLEIRRQIGEKTIASQLRSQGIIVQRQRIRESIRRVDPIGVQLRCRTVLHRRQYNVRSPNSLWHLDGYHKLVRWNFVIHGGIDGFSRLITFLKVSSNNTSQSVLTAFISAVSQFGIPSRIRIDRGGENVLVSRWMLNHPLRGPDRHSVIAGRSVHNQRIERLWRDLYSGCICVFYSFFYYLEDLGLLDKDDVRDKYAMHFVFCPIIQQQLDIFREGWAHHSLRTMNNRTPFQLWVLGLSHMQAHDPGCDEVIGLTEVCNVWDFVTFSLIVLGSFTSWHRLGWSSYCK